MSSTRWILAKGVSYLDSISVATYDLIGERGLAFPGLRAIARETRTAPSTLSHYFASPLEMARLIVVRTANARGSRLSDEVVDRVPRTQRELADERVWLAYVELGRGERALAGPVANQRRTERSGLARVLARGRSEPPDPLLVEAVQVIVDGLVARRLDPQEPLSVKEADAVLALLLRALGRPDLAPRLETAS